MALAHSRVSLASLALVGALVFTGCASSVPDFSGSASSDNSSSGTSSSSSASSSVSLEGIQTLVDSFTTAMTSSNDLEAAFSEMPVEDLDAITAVLGKFSSDLETYADIQATITGFSAEEKAALQKFVGIELNKFSEITDYTGMSEDEQLTFDTINMLLSLAISEDTVSTDDNTVDTADLSPSGNTVYVPMKALAAAADSTEEENFFESIPAIYVDGVWKIDGQQYLADLSGLSF